MSLTVGNKMLADAADGAFGKSDLKKAFKDMLDGKGIERGELRAFMNAIIDIRTDPSVRVSKQTQQATAKLIGVVMNGWDQDEGVFEPTLDMGRVQSILDLYKREPASTRRTGGGSESGTVHTAYGEF